MDEQRELSDAECDAIALDEWHDWHKELGLPRDDDWPMTEWERRIIRRAFRAGAAARAVPREPTAAMIEAWHVADAKLQGASFAEYVPAIWRAMYDAAHERAAGEGKQDTREKGSQYGQGVAVGGLRENRHEVPQAQRPDPKLGASGGAGAMESAPQALTPAPVAQEPSVPIPESLRGMVAALAQPEPDAPVAQEPQGERNTPRGTSGGSLADVESWSTEAAEGDRAIAHRGCAPASATVPIREQCHGQPIEGADTPRDARPSSARGEPPPEPDALVERLRDYASDLPEPIQRECADYLDLIGRQDDAIRRVCDAVAPGISIHDVPNKIELLQRERDTLQQRVREANEYADSQQRQAIKQMERAERAEAELAQARKALETIMRTTAKPFPDPGAHSLDAYARAVHAAWCAMRFTAMRALDAARAQAGQSGGEG